MSCCEDIFGKQGNVIGILFCLLIIVYPIILGFDVQWNAEIVIFSLD